VTFTAKDIASAATSSNLAFSFLLKNIAPSANGKFYSNATCTSAQVTTVTLPANTSTATLYYKDTVAEPVTGVSVPNTYSYGLYGSSATVTGSCESLSVVSLASNGTAVPASANTTLTFSSTGTGAFYSDAACTSSVTTMSLNAGSSEVQLYFKNASSQTVTMTVTDSVGTTGTRSITSSGSGTYANVVIYPDSQIFYTQCARVVVQAQNGGGTASNVPVNTTIRLAHNNIGNFYTDSACATTPTTLAVIPAGASEVVMYYARTSIAPATSSTLGQNSVVSLAGYGTNTGNNTYNYAAFPGVGGVYFNTPTGIALNMSGSAVNGIFVANFNGHEVSYLNNTNAQVTYGGRLFNPYAADFAVNAINPGSAGFNGDGALGSYLWTYWPDGLMLSASDQKLYIGDIGNYRLRSLDISKANGFLNTELGSGFARANLTSAALAAPNFTLSAPGFMSIDQAGQNLYITDSNNYRVHQLSLTTGVMQPIIGKGSGRGDIEGSQPLNVQATGPNGVQFLTSGSNTFLIYSDDSNGGWGATATGQGINQNCNVRAYNMTGPSATIFGITIGSGLVSTLAGNYLLGCQSWVYNGSSGPNNDGEAATTIQLNFPNGVGSDGNNLYIAQGNDHCIIKVNSSGVVSRLIGTCGAAPSPAQDGTANGPSGTASTRFPMGITMDPQYPGNFFFVDSVDQPGKVRYVNFLNQSLSISGVNVLPASTYPTVTTVVNYTPISTYPWSGQSRLNGVAVFDKQICYSSGYFSQNYSWYNGSYLGGHNVTCLDRSSNYGALSIRVGPNETAETFRGGMPGGTEQEGANATDAIINAPYGISFDASGNLYIGTRQEHSIRMVRRWW
jgi:hypothetical protein